MERRRLVLDLDGTLVDTRADLAGSVRHVLAELGVPLRTPEEILGLVGRGASYLMEQALPPDARQPAEVQRAVELFRVHYREHLADASAPYPGVREALARLSAQGRPASVLTNKPGALARRLVAKLGLADVLADVLGPDDLPAKKPDPEGLIEICRRLSVRPGDVWYVGDMDLDVQTARGAGCLAAAVGWGFGPRDTLLAAGPDRVLATPGELVDLE